MFNIRSLQHSEVLSSLFKEKNKMPGDGKRESYEMSSFGSIESQCSEDSEESSTQTYRCAQLQEKTRID